MKSFNLIYENSLRYIISEGGNAFDDVKRIKLKNIKSTVDDFRKNIINELVGYDVKDSLFMIGSTGKKPDSGDLDLCVDASVFQDSVLVTLMKLDELCAEKNLRSYINTINFSMLHISYPQKGLKQNVQIDLLISKYPDFSKFFMYSPTPKESKYKGAHRNVLLHAILTVRTSIRTNTSNNETLEWNQLDISFDGIYKMYKTLLDRNGERLLYKTTNEPLEEEYAKIIKSIPITHNVNEAMNILFGTSIGQRKFDDEVQIEDIDTFEKLFDIIKNGKGQRKFEDSDEILRFAAKMLIEKENRLEFPSELKPYL